MRRDNLNYETKQACFGDVAHVVALYGDFLSCMNPPEESTTDAGRKSGTERSTAAETDSHGTVSGIGSETDKESDESDTEPEESG